MSVFGKLIKNAMVGAVVGTYNIAKEANEKISEQLKEAQLEQSKDDVKRYDEMMSHYTEEEQTRMKAMSKNFAMVDIAKKQAKGRNKLAFLESKVAAKLLEKE